MVEHHVQDDLDAVFLKRPDQALQLGALPVVLHRGGVAGVGGKKAHRIIAPVVHQLPPVHRPLVGHLVKLKNGHQLHRIDAQLLQVGNFFPQAGEGPGAAHPGGGVAGEAPHVDLVDHQILKRPLRAQKIPPVKILPHHPGVIALPRALAAPPHALSGHGPGIGIQQISGPVKPQAPLGVIGAVHAVGVFKLLHIQAEHNHGKGVADAEALREGQNRIGLLLPPAEQTQLTASGVKGIDGKADASRHHIRPVQPVQPRADGIAGDGAGGGQAHFAALPRRGGSPVVHICAPFSAPSVLRCGRLYYTKILPPRTSPAPAGLLKFRQKDDKKSVTSGKKLL